MHKQGNEKRDNDKKQVRTCCCVLKLPELQLLLLLHTGFFLLAGCVFLINSILSCHSVAAVKEVKMLYFVSLPVFF